MYMYMYDVHLRTCTQVLIHKCTCFVYLCIQNTSQTHVAIIIIKIEYLTYSTCMYTHIHISELEILTAHQIIKLSLIQY